MHIREQFEHSKRDQNVIMVSTSDRAVIIGAGVFGLSLAYQLANEGNQNVMVMDRHVPPVSISSILPDHVIITVL